MKMTNKIKNFFGIKEIRNHRVVLRQLFAEFFGTFMYLSLALSAGIGHGANNPTLVIALSNGLLVASIVQTVGHVSGGHINPAVTLGALVGGQIKPLKALCYVVMHIAGSIAGSAVAYAVSADTIRGNLGATVPYQYITQDQTFALEFLMTLLLVALTLSVVDTRRGARGLGSSSLAIGLCVSGCLCTSSPYTGSLNPVRTLGPAVVMGIWDFHWGYWVAPLLGGLVGGLLYKYMFGVYYKQNDSSERKLSFKYFVFNLSPFL